MHDVRDSRRALIPNGLMAVVAVILAVLLLGCGSSSDLSGADKAAYETTFCAALKGLADNQSDFRTVLGSSSQQEALAALERVKNRAASGADGLEEAAKKWAPGADLARGFESALRDLLPILDHLGTAGLNGDVAAWQTASHQYTVWYTNTQTTIAKAVPVVESLGLVC